MGQRSQLYIRYKNKQNLIAMHLQWNYGYYMINRTYQLLKFISENISDEYNNFLEGNESHFELMNGNQRNDINILHNLIQINLTIGSYVAGCDLVKEQYRYFNEEKKDTFIMKPESQDNNNGILVIDILENGKIKYGLAGGTEEIDEMGFHDSFKMISAKDYFILSEKNYDKEYKLENKNQELYKKVLKQIDYIDNNFELLTDKEYAEIFNTEYEYKNCMKKQDLESNKPLF